MTGTNDPRPPALEAGREHGGDLHAQSEFLRATCARCHRDRMLTEAEVLDRGGREPVADKPLHRRVNRARGRFPSRHRSSHRNRAAPLQAEGWSKKAMHDILGGERTAGPPENRDLHGTHGRLDARSTDPSLGAVDDRASKSVNAGSNLARAWRSRLPLANVAGIAQSRHRNLVSLSSPFGAPRHVV
jgi:hypothetical protein